LGQRWLLRAGRCSEQPDRDRHREADIQLTHVCPPPLCRGLDRGSDSRTQMAEARDDRALTFC
jgi:hypothetical protein